MIAPFPFFSFAKNFRTVFPRAKPKQHSGIMGVFYGRIPNQDKTESSQGLSKALK
jgi:hypothetical protein